MSHSTTLKKKTNVLILAGGSGTRLWPLSRESTPKQLLCLYDESSLISHTWKRAKKLTSESQITIGTNKSLCKFIRKDLNLPKSAFLIEPVARNTAPIMALHAIKLQKEGRSQDYVAVLSADHYVKEEDSWLQCCLKALNNITSSNQTQIILVGIRPDRPDTGYGYIETEKQTTNDTQKILQFREKPNLQTAQNYFSNKNFFWNSGIFFYQVDHFLKEMTKHNPQLIDLAHKCINEKETSRNFPQMPNISIDYALLEKTNELSMVPGDFIWEDLGSFLSLEKILPSKDGNVLKFPEKVTQINSSKNLVITEKSIALLGVSDLIIVENKGILLVATKDSIKDIKKIRELSADF